MTQFVQAIVNGLALGGLYALIALGVALVFGLLGLVNLAHGELLMIGGYVIYALGDAPLLVVLPVVVLAVGLAAVVMERTAFRPVRQASPTTLLVTAFALAYLLQSVAQLVYGARPKSVSVAPSLDDSVSFLGIETSKLDLLNIGVTVALLAGLAVFMRRSALGIQMRAAAENFRMARMLGIRADRVISVAFLISGCFAGVAAVLLVAQTGTLTPTMGVAPVLVAFIAAVIGGLGRLESAVLGGVALGLGSVLLQTYLPADLQAFRDAFLFTAVIGVLLIRPQGIFGSKALVARV